MNMTWINVDSCDENLPEGSRYKNKNGDFEGVEINHSTGEHVSIFTNDGSRREVTIYNGDIGRMIKCLQAVNDIIKNNRKTNAGEYFHIHE